MKPSLLYILILLHVNTSLALFEQKESPERNGGKTIVVLYAEEDRFFVESFRIGADGWQERISHKSFATEAKARQAYDSGARSFQPSTFRAQNVSKARTGVAVWEVKDQWNAEWELKYIEWVRANLNTSFFVTYQLETDCADVAFSIRWIFARIHGLPASAVLAGSGQLFTQDDGSASWASIPTSEVWHEDQRFRTALNYVRNNTFTHTLIEDSYPVEINPQGIRPGGYHLTVRTHSGHTRIIDQTNPDGPGSQAIHFVASDVPAKVRYLYAENFAIKYALDKDHGGFMRFRWPQLVDGQYKLVPRDQMPHFSMEQYEGEFLNNYYKTVTSRMGVQGKPEDFLKIRLDTVWQKLNYRVDIVKEGFQFCSTNSCEPDSVNYDDWSTPSRDQQIYDLVVDIYEVLWDNYEDTAVKDEYNRWSQLTLEIQPGVKINYEELLGIWYYKYYTSDPRDALWIRWGLESEPIVETPIEEPIEQPPVEDPTDPSPFPEIPEQPEPPQPPEFPLFP